MVKTNHKAIILAGGKGTRLYPVTKEIPKPLLPIRRKPIINYLVDLFNEYGVKDIAVLVNKEFREEFEWWKKRYYPKSKIQFFEETKELGTFGGLCFAKDWLKGDDFFLTNGDELKRIDLATMMNFHKEMGATGTIALVKSRNPQNYGVVVCRKGEIQEFLEKPKNPPTKYINSGIYLLTQDVFNYHNGLKFSMIETDLFPKLAREKKLAGFKFQGKWLDCGTWDRYSDALDKWKF